MFTLNRRQNRFSLQSEKGNHSKQPKGLFASQKSYELSYNALKQSDEREAHVGGNGRGGGGVEGEAGLSMTGR